MSNEVTWYMDQPLLLNCVAPLDYYPDPAVPVPLQGSMTIAGYIMDKGKKTVTTASAATAQGTVLLQDTSLFAVADLIWVEQQDYTLHPAAIDVVTSTDIEFTPDLTAAVAKGGRVWGRPGAGQVAAGISGVLYGVPDAAKEDWGYAVNIPHDIDGSTYLRRDLPLEAYMLVTQAGGSQWNRLWDVIMAESRGGS